MKRYIFLFCCLFSFSAHGQSSDIETQYQQAGLNDAQILQRAYEKLHKPLFQQAYDDYLEDLEYISQYGTAPDNEALYQDLLQRNSDDKFIYSQTEADKHQFFNIYQNRN